MIVNLDLVGSDGLSSRIESIPPPLLIDDLVDDVVSSISSLSNNNTPVEQRSRSPEPAHSIMNNRQLGCSGEFILTSQDQNPFYEEKRLIEEELEFIRRERENLLQEHEKYRQQALYVV